MQSRGKVCKRPAGAFMNTPFTAWRRPHAQGREQEKAEGRPLFPSRRRRDWGCGDKAPTKQLNITKISVSHTRGIAPMAATPSAVAARRRRWRGRSSRPVAGLSILRTSQKFRSRRRAATPSAAATWRRRWRGRSSRPVAGLSNLPNITKFSVTQTCGIAPMAATPSAAATWRRRRRGRSSRPVAGLSNPLNIFAVNGGF